MSYFEAVVQYDKMQPNGVVKRVSETSLFDALSYTECEARVIEEMTQYISGEFLIKDIKRPRIAELVLAPDDPDADKFYMAKVAFVTIDEKSGMEKQTISALLFQATDFNDAYERLLRHMQPTMADWSCQGLTLTKIIEYFPYKSTN